MRRKAWIGGLACLLLFNLTCASNGQVVVPAEAEEHTLVPAKLEKAVPDGCYLADGGWEVLGATAAQKASIHECQPTALWFTGTPGVYTLVYDGVIVRDVTFTDGAGQQITIKSYQGRVKGRATCVIKGTPSPDPQPDPDPQPGGKYQIVLFYSESQIDNLPQGQRDVLTSLVFRDWLVSQGHVLLEVADPANFDAGSVPETWKRWLAAVSGKQLPILALAPKDGTGTVRALVLPDGVEAAKKVLQSTSVWKAVQR